MKLGCIILTGLATIGLAAAAHAAPFSSGRMFLTYFAYGDAYDGDIFSTPGGTSFQGYFTATAVRDQITYTYLTDVTWNPSVTSLDGDGLYIDNGSLLTSVSGIPAFTSVTIDPSSQLGSSGFNASDVTFNSDNVAVTWMNLTFDTGNTVILDVNSSAVPEPSGWAMMLTGFGIVGYALRKRVRTTPVHA